MSSLYPKTGQTPWRNPDICDIVSPQNGPPEYVPVSEQSQGYANYEIPGFHPSTVQPPEIAGKVQWSSPSDERYFDDGNREPAVPQYYTANTAYDQNFQNMSRFETDSSSSLSSANGPVNVNPAAATPGTGSLAPTGAVGGIQKEKYPRPRKARGKVLDDVEAELIDKDDSLLTEEQLVIKRKAQNRLAQRAFRERKESKLKDLQNKLLASEEERQRLLEKLEEIKSQFISVKTENQVLRSNNSGNSMQGGPGNGHSNNGSGNFQTQGSKFTFPPSQEEFVEQMMSGQSHVVRKETVSKIYDEPQHPGQKVLAVGAVWDYLSLKIEEEEYENIDMMEVMQTLKGNEVCHGYGPAYPLAIVDSALHTVADRQ